MKDFGNTAFKRDKLIKRNITKLLIRLHFWESTCFTLMFSGVAVFLLFFGIIAVTQNGLYAIGIGASVVIMVVPNLAGDAIKKRIPEVEKLKEVLDTIKAYEIIFLSDRIFDNSMNAARIFAQALTESVNLNDYEVIDGRALTKKRLHLSSDLIREITSINRFKNVSRFSSEMLMISESPTLIRSRAYEAALAVSEIPVQNPKLFRAHKDRLLTADFAKAETMNKRLVKIKKIFFISGPVVFIGGMILTIASSVKWIAVPLFGFLLIITGGFLEITSISRQMRISFIQRIIKTINGNRILNLNASCFDGLLPKQKIIIVEKLIAGKKIMGREIIGGTTEADKRLKLTAEKLNKDAETARKKAFEKAVIINAQGLNTNCGYCGASISERNKYCTYCGKLSKTVYTVDNQKQNNAKVKIKLDIPSDINCDNCGDAFATDETYCGNCGTMRKDIRRRL